MLEKTNLSSEEAILQLQKGELNGCYIANLDLSNQKIDYPICIRNSEIGRISFVGTEINTAVNFEEVTFNNDFVAGWEKAFDKAKAAEFNAQIILKKCNFKGKAIFGGCIFHSLFSFQNSIFYDIAVFNATVFKEQAYFWGSKFHARSFFERATFHVEGHFDKCEFLDDASFENTVFEGQDASFSYIRTDGNLHFENSKITCGIAFRKSKLDGELNFKNALFENEAYFVESSFKGTVTFDNVQFKQLVDFSHSKFQGSTSFLYVSFSESKFINSEFNEELSFNLDSHLLKSLGGKEKQQELTCFHQLCDFTNARFHKRVVFEKVVFQEEARFPNCFFGEQANFVGIEAKKIIIFESIYCNQEFSGIDAVFEKVIFDHANINRRLDLSDAKIANISFYKAAVDLIVVDKHQLRGKLIYQNPKKPQFSKSSQEYLLLKESFGQRGLHKEEDWAYYKFRQTKRKNNTQMVFEKVKSGSILQKIVAFFKLISLFFERIVIDRATGYGTRPLNITIVAVSFILFFAAIYSYFPDTLVRPKDMPFGFSQAIYFSFATFTTMGFGDIQPRLDSVMQFVVSTEAFLGLFVMTLFVATYTRKIIR